MLQTNITKMVCDDKTKSGCGNNPTIPPIMSKSKPRIAIASRIDLEFFMLICPPSRKWNFHYMDASTGALESPPSYY